MQKLVTVTKKEAATCQLETAIKLFLENRDLISAYTLCCSADGILEGIYKNEREKILRNQRHQSTTSDGLRFSFAEQMEILVKPEHLKEFFQKLNATQNFFKHADRDHDDSHQFGDWEMTGARLLTTIMNYYIVFQERSPAMNLYFILHAIQNPDLLVKEKSSQSILPIISDIGAKLEGFSRDEIVKFGYFVLMITSPNLFK